MSEESVEIKSERPWKQIAFMLVGAFITMVFNYFHSEFLLERQNYYQEKQARQEFILDFSKDLKDRIYKGLNFFWSVRDRQRRITTLKYWNIYSKSVMNWNTNRAGMTIDLDLKFPKGKYLISDYSDTIFDKLSFSEYFMEDIHKDWMRVHGKLIELRKIINNSGQPNKHFMKVLEIEIQDLDNRIDEFIKALSNATQNQKVQKVQLNVSRV